MMLSACAFGFYNCSKKKKKKRKRKKGAFKKLYIKKNKRKKVNLSKRTSTANVGHYLSECDHQPLIELRSHTDS